jgi:diguanylate cyclase (GGDEF)-like protein
MAVSTSTAPTLAKAQKCGLAADYPLDVQSHVRIRLFVVTAVALIAATVWVAGERQRGAANQTLAEVEAAEQLLTAMLDQEAGMLAYVETGRRAALARYNDARGELESAFAQAEAGAPAGEADEVQAIQRQRQAARRWQSIAERHLDRRHDQGDAALPAAEARALDALGRQFRELNTDFKEEVIEEGDRNERRAVLFTAGMIFLLCALFVVAGYLGFDRRARQELRRRETHARFSEVLELARTESEAYQLVKRYLERLVPASFATVLNRNNSANRLEASTPVEGTRLQETLEGAEPESCLAVRGGKTHARRLGEEALLKCEVCGNSPANTTCVPSLVGGEVIGSVLVEHPKPMRGADVKHMTGTIASAAPILANLRNLAIAEHRAATDALTGLANSRSVRENLKRMAAHAGRTATPLSVVIFDLDRFKKINDTFGHGKGDEVLAAVGAVASDTVRASDLVGRYGGEEFLVLLPDTMREGAMNVAEKLRQAISELSVPGMDWRITSSFGVAVLPADAGEPEELLRAADRALYLAKTNGRNRVETLPSEAAEALDPLEV